MKSIFIIVLLVFIFSCKRKEDPITLIPTPPGQVSGVKISKATITNLMIEWTAVKGAAGYKVYEGNFAYYDAKATSFELAGLTGNTLYTFQVSAYNNHGEGPKSLTVSGKTLTPPSPPGVVMGCKVKSVTSSGITWQWSSLADAEGYRLYREGIKVYEGNDMSFEDKGLKPETSYLYQISAYNVNGEGPILHLLAVKTGG
ncbi:fibronectin type III domain-containing protein [Runella aurantiaca]|uniref:Fibronectin type III domain-containing protein n=1 Tax=Runella aurantiaca TaxID=2282308 RepID=A0A369IKD7_9BACT|nr:fibronectin type III domain-containing protein [Runella aurantiaca]RDB07833.1 fibronectin type III domain-containing protein [Runella aurantiaca]